MEVDDLLEQFNDLAQTPEVLLTAEDGLASSFRLLTKSIYDFTKKSTHDVSEDVRKSLLIKKSLPVLHLTDFDEEQVWQEIELENKPFLNEAVKNISRFTAQKRKLSFRVSLDGLDLSRWNREDAAAAVRATTVEEVVSDEEESGDDDQEDSDEDGFDDERGHGGQEKRIKIKSSVVDDQFFKLSELEEFLNLEDDKEEKNRDGKVESDDEDEDDVDFFEANSDSGEDEADELGNGREAMFKSFFDRPHGDVEDKSANDEEEDEEEKSEEESLPDEEQLGEDNPDLDTRDFDPAENETEATSKIKNLFEADFSDKEDDESEGESIDQILGHNADRTHTVDNRNKSDFEKQQESLQEKIKAMEKESLKPKTWQVAGESTGEKRPENSLLQEHLQFDYVNREAPLITEETTFKLEDIIMQRVKNASWDDVERKVKPTEQAFEFRRRITLDHDKSKASLAEVYEKEYLRQTEDQTEEENPLHKEIRIMTRNIFLKLDALSNFNFTPKPIEPEVKIINNLPAISAEEAIPTAVSDGALLAPEEVTNKARRDIKSIAERTDTDRKRERRFKKKNQGVQEKHRQAKEKNLSKIKNDGLGNKYSKLANQKELEAAKKSTLSNDDDTKRKEIERLTKNAFKSSKSFFAKLQDEVHNPKKAKTLKPVHSAKSLKL